MLLASLWRHFGRLVLSSASRRSRPPPPRTTPWPLQRLEASFWQSLCQNWHSSPAKNAICCIIFFWMQLRNHLLTNHVDAGGFLLLFVAHWMWRIALIRRYVKGLAALGVAATQNNCKSLAAHCQQMLIIKMFLKYIINQKQTQLFFWQFQRIFLGTLAFGHQIKQLEKDWLFYISYLVYCIFTYQHTCCHNSWIHSRALTLLQRQLFGVYGALPVHASGCAIHSLILSYFNIVKIRITAMV